MKKLVLITVLAMSVVLCLGALSAYGQEKPPEPPKARQGSSEQVQQRQGNQAQRSAANMPRMLIRLLDLNNDGQVSLREYMKFFTDADKNEDGAASQQEMMAEMSKRRQEMGRRPSEASGRSRQERGPQQGQRPQQGPGPNVGDDAPDFALISLDGKRTVKLSDFKGRETVVLVFGSYT